jgi:hypothetical protein
MFEITWDVYKQNVMITGEAQSGKTNFGKIIAKILQLNGCNVLVRDPHRRFTNVDPMCVKTSLGELNGTGLEIYQPQIDSERDFADLTGWVNTRYNLVYMFDEAHNDCRKQKAPKSLDFLCRNCNNRSIGYIAIFQRPAEVPNYLLSNAHHKFVFHLDLPTDIDYMKKYIGVEMERFSADSINPMPKYHGLYKTAGKRVEEFTVDKFD